MEATVQPASGASGEGVHVLYVDDEPAMAEIVTRMLDAEGLAVTTETDPETAAERVRETGFDCVVSDYDMPEVDGFDLLAAVRETDPDLPFILYTGKGSEEIASRAISAGVTDYLQKRGGREQYELLANRIRNAARGYRTSQRVRAERERFQSLIEHSADVTLVVDETGRITYLSPAAEHVLGYEPSAATGRRIDEFVHPSDRREAMEQFAALTADDDARTREFHTQLRHADGSWRWVAVVGTVPDASTPIDGVVLNVRDVTERKRRAERLREAANAMTCADSQREACELAVAAAVDVLELPLASVWLQESEGDALRPVAATEATRDTFEELPVYQPGNSLSWEAFERGETIVCDPGSAESGYNRETSVAFEVILPVGEYGVMNVGSVSETTRDEVDIEHARVLVEHLRAALASIRRRRAIEASRTRFRTLFEQSADAVFIHDTDGRIHDANRRACELLGFDRETLLDSSMAELGAGKLSVETTDAGGDDADAGPAGGIDASEIDAGELADESADGDDLQTVYDELEPGETQTLSGTLRRADGSTVTVEARLSATEIDGRRRIIASVRDVTERNRRAAALERKNELLENFVSVVSHDLRNPLNVAMGRLELGRETGDDEELAAVAEAHDRMNELIDDLLTMAQQGRESIDPEPVTLASIVNDCWGTIDAQAASVTVPDPGRIVADRSKLRQLFENLFGNAVAHAGPDVSVTVGTCPGGFYVADDGPGIPPDERERVFEAGYSTDENGTGFGLGIVQQVADLHGWAVRITDGPDGGARFEFTGVESPDGR